MKQRIYDSSRWMRDQVKSGTVREVFVTLDIKKISIIIYQTEAKE